MQRAAAPCRRQRRRRGRGHRRRRGDDALLARVRSRRGDARRGSPREASARSLARVEAKHYRVQACLVALRKDGAFGAAKIGEPPFSYAVKNARLDEVRRL